jgi:hypothetical protein
MFIGKLNNIFYASTLVKFTFFQLTFKFANYNKCSDEILTNFGVQSGSNDDASCFASSNVSTLEK